MSSVLAGVVGFAAGGTNAATNATSTEGSGTGATTDGTTTPANGTGNVTTSATDVVDTGFLPEWVLGWPLNLVLSVVVFGLAVLVSRLVVRLLGRRLARRFDRPSLTRTALRGIRTLIFTLALLTVLGIWGLGLGDIALQVTVLTAVVGVILAPIVGSFISGVFLLADQPYEIGDMVQLDEAGTRGYVEDITLRYTKVFTLENTFLVIPNGTIRERDVYNFSAEDPRTRISVGAVITYESDLPRAQESLENAARSVQGVIDGGPSIRVGSARYPASPTCLVDEFADHGVHLTLRFWVREPYRIPAVRSTVQENVWEAVQDSDVEFAYPHSHLFFDETSGDLSVNTFGGRGDPGRGGRPQVRGSNGGRDGPDDPGATGDTDGTDDSGGGGDSDTADERDAPEADGDS